MTNLLITGSTGFVGQPLTKALRAEYKLFCPNHHELDLSRDLQPLDLYVRGNNIDFIVHLAHPRLRNTVGAVGESVSMMKNLLETCRLNRIGILYLSSLLSRSPKGSYGESKFLCEELVRLYQKNYGLETILLRPSAIYGKGMDRATFISKFFEFAMKGETIHTHEYNNGLPVFDFLYIDDLIEAIRLSLKGRPTIPLDIGTGIGTSTYEIAEAIVKSIGSSSRVELIQIPGDTSKFVANTEEAEREIGWRYKTKLEEGLIRMIGGDNE